MNRPLVTVVGDAILDRDLVGTAARLSPEAPVPVLVDVERFDRPGGAGLAALLALQDGADVRLVTAVGDDAPGRRLLTLLRDAGVDVLAFTSGGPTAVKTRLRCGSHALARIDEGPALDQARWMDSGAIRPAVRGSDAVLVCDYGRGLLSHGAVRRVLDHVDVPLVWDPHPRGFTPPRTTFATTPNRAEAEHFTRACLPAAAVAEPQALTTALLAVWPTAAVCLTDGSSGAVVQRRGEEHATRVPAVPVMSPDTCGAGDRFAASVAASLARGDGLLVAVKEAVHIAAEFVGRGAASSVRAVRAHHEEDEDQWCVA